MNRTQLPNAPATQFSVSKPQQRRNRIALICGLFIGCLLLGACSSTSFVYNRLDTLLPWYLDDYAQLNRDQEKHLDELLVPFLQWHRREELPRYVVLIDELQTTLESPVSTDDLEMVVESFRLAWLRMESEGLDWMLSLGDTLSDDQVAEFIAALREKHEESSKKLLKRDDDVYEEENYENFRDNATDYVGRLSKTQRRALEAASENLQRADALWLEEQSLWIDQLETLMTREAGWQARVREAVAARPQNAPAPYQAVIENNTTVIQKAVADLLNSLTEKQSKHLAKKLSKLRNDLHSLSTG
ncbi:MAG: DUF6279 family lipoprotein [Halioglobus sp.]